MPSHGRRHGLRPLAAAALLAVLVVTATSISASADGTRAQRFAAAQSWGYQLQNIDPARLSQAPFDVLVVDADGQDSSPLTAADVTRMQRAADGRRRIVLAYMSIGEAESYRAYWDWKWGGGALGNILSWFFSPSWLGAENSAWTGNYAVRYWQDGWQRIILGDGGYLDRIVAAGFDGVYLDKVDASLDRIARGRPSAKDDMRMLIARIAEKGRRLSPGFLIVPQNGEELLDDPAHVALIDGMGKEDLLYGEFKHAVANPIAVVQRRAALLAPLLAARKPVLAVEYIDDIAAIRVAADTLLGLGCIPHFADRDLAFMRFSDAPEASSARSRQPRRR